MSAETALSLWSAACRETGIPWFLFRETLLCAHVLHQLPDTLDDAQIAVFAKDLPDLLDRVFPKLPETWVLDKSAWVGSQRQLVFRQDESVVLQIFLLYGVEDQEQMRQLSAELGSSNRKLRLWKLIQKCGSKFFGALYLKTIGKLLQRHIQKLELQHFPKVVSRAAGSGEALPFYSDYLTNPKPVLLQQSWFSERLPVSCTCSRENLKVQYPSFGGFREYLTQIFGDYEAGFTDPIGCGLTKKEKEDLCHHQARCFEALAFVQTLSQEFGLRYYLLAGSVLGAVRHGGFIPWDDDIDIGIRVEDLEEFEKILKEHLPQRLPEGFTLKQSGPDNPFPRMFSKICFEGRCCIDLWPLVPTYCDGFRAKYQWYFAKLITKVHYEKIGHPNSKFGEIAKPIAAVLSDKLIMALARRNETKYIRRQTPAYINLYSIYRRPKELIYRRWLDTPATAFFNGLEVPVVGHTDKYLAHLYGDYTAFPPPWKRASRHVDRF